MDFDLSREEDSSGSGDYGNELNFEERYRICRENNKKVEQKELWLYLETQQLVLEDYEREMSRGVSNSK